MFSFTNNSTNPLFLDWYGKSRALNATLTEPQCSRLNTMAHELQALQDAGLNISACQVYSTVSASTTRVVKLIGSTNDTFTSIGTSSLTVTVPNTGSTINTGVADSLLSGSFWYCTIHTSIQDTAADYFGCVDSVTPSNNSRLEVCTTGNLVSWSYGSPATVLSADANTWKSAFTIATRGVSENSRRLYNPNGVIFASGNAGSSYTPTGNTIRLVCTDGSTPLDRAIRGYLIGSGYLDGGMAIELAATLRRGLGL